MKDNESYSMCFHFIPSLATTKYYILIIYENCELKVFLSPIHTRSNISINTDDCK